MRSSDAEKFEDPGRQKVNYKSAVLSYKWTIIWVVILLAFDAYATAGIALSVLTLIVNLVFRLPFHLWRWKVSKLGSVDYIYRCLSLIFVSICIISYGIHMGSVLKERARLVSTAVEQFRSREGIYPSSLEALVPKDLAELPPGYRYLHSKDGDPYLYYPSNLAPRPVLYDFKTKSWELRD
jgi:hypothetical protein